MTTFDKYKKFAPDYHYRQVSRRFRTYNAFVDARFKKLVENVEGIAKNKNLKLLDVGCGDGVALSLLSKRLPHLEFYGVEPSKEALDVAKKQVPKARLAHGSAEALPFEEGMFDIVISSDVIEHVENPDYMLQEIKRVAKPDAYVVIGTPIRHSKFPLDYNHVQEFFIEDFEELLKRHFKEAELYESHNLAFALLYNAPTSSFLNFKYFINLLSLFFNYNPFLAARTNRMQMFAYMYAVCRK